MTRRRRCCAGSSADCIAVGVVPRGVVRGDSRRGAVSSDARRCPQPPLTVTQTVLPGDSGDAKAATAPAPAAGTMLGRLEAPSVKLSTAVLEGSDDGTLSRGSGHIEDTPFPGQPGNVGIAGHRDTTFRAAAQHPRRRRARVQDGRPAVSLPDQQDDDRRARRCLRARSRREQPALTLVTCYPFEFVGHAPRRFIVRADLVGEERRWQDRRARAEGRVR